MPGTDTYLGLRAFVDELVALRPARRDARRPARARRRWCSPSRASRGLRATSHLDERSAAFFALGLAKATGIPAALACTSGTAAANYAPAVIEAHEARVPLLVLTADRPPELRDVGAGQTIDQVKLYGSAAKWYFEVDDHPASRRARALAAPARLPGVLHRDRRPARPGAPELRAARAARARWRRRAGRRDRPGPRGRAAVGDAAADGARGLAAAAGRPRGRAAQRAAKPIVVAGRAERDPRLAAARGRLRRARRRAAAGRAALRRPPRAGRDRALRRAAARSRVGGRARARAGPARRRPSDLQAAARSGSRAWTRCRSRSTPRPPGRTRPASSARSSAPTRARRSRRSPASCRASARTRRWLDGWHEADRAASRAIAAVVGPAGLNEPRIAAELGTLLPPEADAGRRVLDADPRRRDVLPRPRDAVPRALQPRGERDRRDGLDRVRRGRRGARADRAADRRRRARARHRRADGRLAARPEARDRADRQRRRRHLPLPPRGEPGRGLRRAHRDAARAGLRPRRRAVRPRLRARRRRRRLPRRAAAGGGRRDARTIICVRTDRERNVDLHRRVWESVRAAT